MKTAVRLFLVCCTLISFLPLMAQTNTANSLYDFSMETITGDTLSLSDYAGKVVLVVNVASRCGLTPQYEDLQALYDEFSEQGLVILGFPANNFMGQEPGSNEQIQEFCTSNYGVTFPMFAKISVKGRDQHPLYQFLEAATDQAPSWNFHKYLIGPDGAVIREISPRTRVTEAGVREEIQTLLTSLDG